MQHDGPGLGYRGILSGMCPGCGPLIRNPERPSFLVLLSMTTPHPHPFFPLRGEKGARPGGGSKPRSRALRAEEGERAGNLGRGVAR